MAYDRKKIFKQALKEIEEKKLFFIEDLAAYIPIAKKTIYEWWPIDSNESNAIKEALDKNKTEIKVSMRNKWYKSDNPTLQMGLMKLIGTDEEAHRLNGSKQEIKEVSVNYDIKTDLSKLSDETLDKVLKELEDNEDNA